MPSDFIPNNVWGSAVPEDTEQEITTPSGQTCRAKKMTIPSMIEMGILAEGDAITAIVSKHIRKVKGGNGKADGIEVDETAILSDPAALKSIIGLTDKVMPHVVVSPRVALHYSETTVGKTTVTKRLTDDERALILADHPGTVFTDQIDLEDKMFLFDWAAGGIKAMTSFREGPASDVGSVVNRKGSKKQTKRRPRDN